MGQARAEARAAEGLEGQDQEQAVTSSSPVAGLVVGLAAEVEEKDKEERLGQRAAMAAW
jgi:hypothetical protein